MTTRTATSPLRVIGYARLSDASREESTSIARQRAVITSTAESRGYDLVGIEVDADVSATKVALDDRAALGAVRTALAEGRADAVLVWRLDRLARSVGDMTRLLDEGVAVISATEAIDTASSMGRAMVEVLQVFAGLEARSIGERVRNSVRHLRESDRYPGGNLPYGYRPVRNPDGEGRVLVVDPAEAAIVREAADRVLSGESLYRTARDLNERGIPTRRGKQWSIQSLRQLLTGEAVLGRVRVGGDLRRDERGRPLSVWPPVLPLEDVEALRARLAPRPAGERRKRAARLLSGVLRCSGCGSTLLLHKNGSGVTSYVCRSRSAGRLCDANVSVSADAVDEHLEAAYLDMHGHLAEYRESPAANPSTAALAEVEEALRETALAMTSPTADVSALAARLVDLRAERERLQEGADVTTTEPVATGRTLAQAWAAAEGPEGLTVRRALLAQALAAPVVVDPGERGRRGLDPSRLSTLWRAEADGFDPAWLDD